MRYNCKRKTTGTVPPYMRDDLSIEYSFRRITVRHALWMACNSTDSALLPSPASADENVGKVRQRINM